MAFDVDAFRKAAEAAGISKAEIENEIKFQTSAPAKTDPFEKDEGGFKLGSLEQVQERLGNDWWHLPAGLAAIGAGIYGASRLMSGGSNDPNTPDGRPTYRFDPTFDVEPLPPQASQAPAPAPDRLQQAQQIIEANKQLGIGGQPVPPTAPVAAPVTPPEPISTPITAAPVDAPAPQPTAGPGSPVTSIVNDTVKEMIQETPDPVTGATSQPVAPPQELRTGTGKPAFAGMGPQAPLSKKGKPKFKNEYASVADIPSGYAFVPGAQFIDTIRQNIGQAPYTEFFTKRDFPLTNQSAIEQSREINRLLGRATRAENIAAGRPPAEITRGITQPISQQKGTGMGTKTTRVAGLGLGALVAIPEIAKAQTSAERGMAGASLLEAVLPPGFTMSGAGEGSSAVPSVDQALLLGSPYAQTEFAKKRRQQEEYTRKVGAGRGIAPPSAYLR
jgi:hypothetical protein